MSQLSIIFAGSGEFGLPTLGALLASEHRLVRVISQPDRPAGRGRKLTPTPVSQFAIENQLELFRPAKIGEEALPQADLMVVIAFGQKIPEQIVHHARLGSINLHASLLPRYRGAAPIHHAILAGDAVTGNSVIRLAQRMDAGAILGQSKRAIGDDQTAGDLHDLLAGDGPGLVLEIIEQLAAGRATESAQDESMATAAPKISREMASLDFGRPAREIARKINGLSPWPGCRVRILNAGGGERSRATLLRAVPVLSAAATHGAPGAISDDGIIEAGDGEGVRVLQIQPESKRPMTMDQFRNGHPLDAGMTIESIM